MSPSLLKSDSAETHMSRRMIIGGIPATFALTACVPKPGSLGENRFVTSTSSEATIDHSVWNALLQTYVTESPDGVNLVEYQRLRTEALDSLTAYLEAMQSVAIEEFGADEQFAFWVNLYNAATIDLIVKNLPVKSIRNLGILTTGPWNKDVVTVSGRTLTLNNIEHDILRPEWKDVRIHYAVNCASIGCPNLAREAYTGAKLESMLEQAARDYINHPRGFGGEPNGLVASTIYKWYQVDWGSEQGVLDHARSYAEGPAARLLAEATEINDYRYDWALNSA